MVNVEDEALDPGEIVEGLKAQVNPAGAEQVIVTAAVAQDVPPVLTGARFEVAEGSVTRAGGG